jgi:hypothetical protein
VHDLNLLELVGETLRGTLDDLAAAAPDWLRVIAPPAWFERYTRRLEEYRLPEGREARRRSHSRSGLTGLSSFVARCARRSSGRAKSNSGFHSAQPALWLL